MNQLIKHKSILALSLLAISAVLFVYSDSKESKDITKDIEQSRFTIIRTIESSNTWPVYLAAYNSCKPSSSPDIQCLIECGYGKFGPCYFYTYDRHTQKPRIIAKYYNQNEILYQTLMEFKDWDTIKFITRKDLEVKDEMDSHFIFYTKELNLKTGAIKTVNEKETYETYDSMP